MGHGATVRRPAGHLAGDGTAGAGRSRTVRRRSSRRRTPSASPSGPPAGLRGYGGRVTVPADVVADLTEDELIASFLPLLPRGQPHAGAQRRRRRRRRRAGRPLLRVDRRARGRAPLPPRLEHGRGRRLARRHAEPLRHRRHGRRADRDGRRPGAAAGHARGVAARLLPRHWPRRARRSASASTAATCPPGSSSSSPSPSTATSAAARPVLRSGARPGDVVAHSGRLGPQRRRLRAAHLRTPRRRGRGAHRRLPPPAPGALGRARRRPRRGERDDGRLRRPAARRRPPRPGVRGRARAGPAGRDGARRARRRWPTPPPAWASTPRTGCSAAARTTACSRPSRPAPRCPRGSSPWAGWRPDRAAPGGHGHRRRRRARRRRPAGTTSGRSRGSPGAVRRWP